MRSLGRGGGERDTRARACTGTAACRGMRRAFSSNAVVLPPVPGIHPDKVYCMRCGLHQSIKNFCHQCGAKLAAKGQKSVPKEQLQPEVCT